MKGCQPVRHCLSTRHPRQKDQYPCSESGSLWRNLRVKWFFLSWRRGKVKRFRPRGVCRSREPSREDGTLRALLRKAAGRCANVPFPRQIYAVAGRLPAELSAAPAEYKAVRPLLTAATRRFPRQSPPAPLPSSGRSVRIAAADPPMRAGGLALRSAAGGTARQR